MDHAADPNQPAAADDTNMPSSGPSNTQQPATTPTPTPTPPPAVPPTAATPTQPPVVPPPMATAPSTNATSAVDPEVERLRKSLDEYAAAELKALPEAWRKFVEDTAGTDSVARLQAITHVKQSGLLQAAAAPANSGVGLGGAPRSGSDAPKSVMAMTDEEYRAHKQKTLAGLGT